MAGVVETVLENLDAGTGDASEMSLSAVHDIDATARRLSGEIIAARQTASSRPR